MGRWLDAVEGRVDGGPPPGWHDLRGAWATLRAVQRLAEADVEQALACAETGRRPGDRPGRARIRDGPAPARNGLPRRRPTVGGGARADRRLARRAAALDGPPLLGLQAACSLALALVQRRPLRAGAGRSAARARRRSPRCNRRGATPPRWGSPGCSWSRAGSPCGPAMSSGPRPTLRRAVVLARGLGAAVPGGRRP